MSKNVAVFVDVANIFYAAKAAGVDIDYVTLLKSASAGRDLVRAYAYTGLDPDNENQRNFHSFLARNGYRVVSKDIRKYGDGKVKANLDIELVVDMMKTARNLDIAIVVSGDGDFAPAIRAVQEMGVRVEVISFRGNTSSDLMDVADQFTDITALARVEKGSSRSGRRVAGDDQDLSMTEVPDKQTEGTTSRSRGAGGRRRGRSDEAPAAARGRGRGAASARPAAPAPASAGGASLVALPGEKLSRAPAAADEPAAEPIATPEAEDVPVPAVAAGSGGEAEDAEGERRRRRRRGGRGRGRGRGRADGAEPEGEAEPELEPVAAVRTEAVAEEPEILPPPRGPRPTPFGSVWDSQLGVPTAPTSTPPSATLPDEDEDFEEPAIPEYLIAEQRQQRGGGGMGAGSARGMGGGGRGARNRSAYAAAIERERYGRGGGGGINRYPDVSGRERDRGEHDRGERDRGERDRGGRDRGGRGGRPPRDQGAGRQERPKPARVTGSSEPWSEVPPEVEAMLRAQMAQRTRPPQPLDETPAEPVATDTMPPAQPAEGDAAPKRRSTRRKAAADTAAATASAAPAEATATVPEGETPAPKRPSRRRTSAAAAAPEAGEPPAGAATAEVPEEKPKRRTTRRSTAASADAGDAVTEATAEAPKRATRRRSTSATADAAATAAAAAEQSPDSAAADAPEAKPRRRTTRRATAGSTDST